MPSEPESVDEATAAVAAWLPHPSAEKSLPGQSIDQLSSRFIKVAARAGFGMGIVRIDERYTARWTHTRLNGSELPDSGFSSNDDDARIRACSALLKVPKAAPLLDPFRLPEI
jgi:hypothetical protein